MSTNARAFHIPRVPPRCCRWCAAPISHGRKDRTWHDGREDEPDCLREFRLHTDRAVQFTFTAKRDGLKCWDCEESPRRWRRGCVSFIGGTMSGKDFKDSNGLIWAGGTRYCGVEYVTALELEHEVPLWRTTHLTWEDWRPYFGPKNLRLRCPACHAPKTRQEAKLRAKEKRQAKLRVDAERKEPRRKIQGRGFQPGQRPLQSRPFQKRKP